MNEVVNWFLLLIIFVFDPLAIALVVAANMAFAQIRPKEGFEDDTLSYKETEPSETLIQRVKENQEKLKVEDYIRESNVEKPEEYFSDLEDFIAYNREEGTDNLTYPKFVDKHYPKVDEDIEIDERRMDIIGQNGNDGLHYEETRVIKSEEDLNEEELNELSREVGKTESIEEITPINPTEEELEKLEETLNITYNDEDVPFDRITDTTKTFIDNTNSNKEEETDDEGKKLRYKGR